MTVTGERLPVSRADAATIRMRMLPLGAERPLPVYARILDAGALHPDCPARGRRQLASDQLWQARAFSRAVPNVLASQQC